MSLRSQLLVGDLGQSHWAQNQTVPSVRICMMLYMAKTRVNLTIDADLWAGVESLAEKMRRSKTSFVEEGLSWLVEEVYNQPDYALEHSEAKQVKYNEERTWNEEAPSFRCPVRVCEFRAKSPAARCPDHGRVVV